MTQRPQTLEYPTALAYSFVRSASMASILAAMADTRGRDSPSRFSVNSVSA